MAMQTYRDTFTRRMPEPLSIARRLLAPLAAIAAVAVCLGSQAAPAQTPLCTLTFGEPLQPAVLNDAARGCLNRAAAEYRSHPGAHIGLSGQMAVRVQAAQQYLVTSDAVPAGAIRTRSGSLNALLVQVTIELAPGAEVQPKPPTRQHQHDTVTRTGGDTPKSVPPHEVPGPVIPQQVLPKPLLPRPVPGPVPHPAPDPYADSQQVQDWVDHLKSGNIDFNNPGTMVVGKPTGIVVVIHGYQDQSHSNLPGVVGQGTLKVSEEMSVDLGAPLAPGEFQITPAHGAKQSILPGGSATWTFQVTPTNKTSAPQTLVIQPYLFQPGKNDAQPVLDRTFTVQVTAESLWHHLRDLWSDDPIKVVKYFLPGGQGWSGIGAFLTGLIALLTSLGIIAWIKRKIDARSNPGKGSSDAP